MSETKHTPGPWVRRGADTYRWQIECGENPKKAIVVARITTPKGGIPVSDANANLIAASPEMLIALEAVLDDMGGPHERCSDATMDLVSAALKKAGAL